MMAGVFTLATTPGLEAEALVIFMLLSRDRPRHSGG